MLLPYTFAACHAKCCTEIAGKKLYTIIKGVKIACLCDHGMLRLGCVSGEAALPFQWTLLVADQELRQQLRGKTLCTSSLFRIHTKGHASQHSSGELQGSDSADVALAGSDVHEHWTCLAGTLPSLGSAQQQVRSLLAPPQPALFCK